MLIPDFTLYSLAILDGEDVLYASSDSGLGPLCEALELFSGKSGLTLHDKIMGLAAARLAFYSGVISDIFALVASVPAKEFLDECHIHLTAFDYAANILTRDKRTVCPFELLAMSVSDPDDFINKLSTMIYRQDAFPERLTQ